MPAEDYSPVDYSPVNSWQNSAPRKTLLERSAPLMLVVLLVMAFVLGSMWSKLNYLESGAAPSGTGGTGGTGGTAGVPNSKYKNLNEAFEDFAREAGADGKKLVACVNGGSKKEVVDADFAEGSGLGVQGTPGFYVNGIFLGGAFPYEMFKEIIDLELAGKATTNPSDYSASLQTAITQGALVLTRKQAGVGKAPVRGSQNARISIVEYSDFQCPFCSRAHPTMQQLLSEYDGRVKLAYKHFPLAQIHPNAAKASEASECARDQGKFWEYHDILFTKQADWANLSQT